MNMFIKSIIAAAVATVTLAAQAEIVVKDAWVRGYRAAAKSDWCVYADSKYKKCASD
jgi:copper(I)-binding protein